MIWHRNVTQLIECGYAVLLLDLPGFGRHRVEKEEDAHIKHYANFVQSVLVTLHVLPERCIVVGMALGGFAALQWALRFPAKALVLVGSPGGIMTDSIRRCKDESDLTDARFCSTFDTMTPLMTLDVFLADSEHSLSCIEDAFLYRQIARQNDSKISERNFKDWMDECKLSPPFDLGVCRTLVIAGELDRSWSVEALTQVALELDASFKVIKGVGHTPCFESPLEFNSILKDFIDSVCESATMQIERTELI